MFPIKADILDAWLKDYEEFNYAFRSFCFAQFRVHSLNAEFIPNVTRQIHQQWVLDHQRWLEEEADKSTTQLSHIKILALLLHNLCAENFLGNMFEHEYDEEPKYIFQASEEVRQAARGDLIDAREALLALDFCLLIADWFEKNRIDRSVPYAQRLTPDMRHDLLNYLLSGECERKALYLILKALYLRPGAGKAN